MNSLRQNMRRPSGPFNHPRRRVVAALAAFGRRLVVSVETT
jgi:hypothetical protein